MKYAFTLTSTSPMLMHFDDVEWADDINAWRLDPQNTKRKGENSGDDRRPAHTWIGYLYQNDGHVVVPSANLSSCLKKAGSRVPLGRMKTFKELAVSGIIMNREYFQFFNDGAEISFDPINDLKEEREFRKHKLAATAMGFELDIRRAVVGTSKHVRVRPRFKSWAVRGEIEVTAHEISGEVLQSIFDQAGRVGLGDWRPGSPKSPGPFGMFEAKLKPLK